MSHDPHPNLHHLEKMFGTDDVFERDQRALQNFTRYSPNDRTDIIAITDAAVVAEDGVSLRQKSQLLKFSRELKTADGLLRKANR